MRALAIVGVGLSLVGIGVSLSGLPGAAAVVLGILICVIALLVWFKDAKTQSTPEQPKRVGYIGREESKGNLRRARFGKSLDVGIDNAGEVDGEEAKFSE